MTEEEAETLAQIGKAIDYGYLPSEGTYTVEQVEEALVKVIIHDAIPETWTRVEQEDGTVLGLRRIMIDGQAQIECEEWSKLSID